MAQALPPSFDAGLPDEYALPPEVAAPALPIPGDAPDAVPTGSLSPQPATPTYPAPSRRSQPVPRYPAPSYAALVIPPTAARFWTDDMRVLAALAAGFGGLAAVAGSLLSATFDRIAVGPTIVLCGTAIFLVSLLLGTKRGVLRQPAIDLEPPPDREPAASTS